jgi:uncharacterized protein with LGFP repeats
MPTPSGRFRNWSNVVFTTEANVDIPILGITDLQIDPRAQTIAGAGDADLGPSTKNLSQEDPQVTITTERLAILRTLIPGLKGSLTMTHNDADNEEGTGAMVYTVANCMIANTPRGGAFRQYGTGRIIVETYRPDGRTNPIAITVAA